ncbi:MAG: hypothetical protein EOM92_19560 [Gammaproteobacteria bacterium]|jgi:hypothetical protein|nr:hypothetical protein [Gammaproteobacteria bacterium]
MKTKLSGLFLAATVVGMPLTVDASNDFTGIVESRPAGIAGTWRIGGRAIEATATTKLDEDDGPAQVGACVSVDFEGAVVEEIETERASKCK